MSTVMISVFQAFLKNVKTIIHWQLLVHSQKMLVFQCTLEMQCRYTILAINKKDLTEKFYFLFCVEEEIPLTCCLAILLIERSG